jgi:predicted metal-dependent hydrolase
MGQSNTVIIKPHARRRQYALEIDATGAVIVRTPARPIRSTIQRILADHSDWIQLQKTRVAQKTRHLSDWHSDNHVAYRGTLYPIGVTKTAAITVSTNGILLPQSVSKSAFIAKYARLYLPQRCYDIAHSMQVSVSKIRIRHMRSCWGTCHRNHSITLNQALIHVPDWVSDYVMIHECAHRIHFNHSLEFWNLVKTYTDRVSEAKKWLRYHQPVLLKPLPK